MAKARRENKERRKESLEDTEAVLSTRSQILLGACVFLVLMICFPGNTSSTQAPASFYEAQRMANLTTRVNRLLREVQQQHDIVLRGQTPSAGLSVASAAASPAKSRPSGKQQPPGKQQTPSRRALRDGRTAGTSTINQQSKKRRQPVKCDWNAVLAARADHFSSSSFRVLDPKDPAVTPLTDFPCEEGELHKCACQVQCRDQACMNALEVCERHSDACSAMVTSDRSIWATLKRGPNALEQKL